MTHCSALLRIGAVITVCLMAGCSSLSYQPDEPMQAYIASGSDELSRNMPIILGGYPSKSYNQIGQPEIIKENGRIKLRINTDASVAYTEKRHFKTTRDHQYTNLIYRIHFEQVPFSLLPFNLTTGKNVGLIFVITLNEKQQAVLVTTVHTCGCYLAIVPTNHLPVDAYPDDWNLVSQNVFGATLPGLLSYSDPVDYPGGDEKVVIYLHDETHRVMHLDIAKHGELAAQFVQRQLTIKPMNTLDRLKMPDNNETVSMFESSGSRHGYVRDSYKPLELLLMSWWSFDYRIGVDKRYGTAGDDAPIFYTSIKPWARKASDMRDFSGFLEYWGWRL